jgi:hypothetical protein
MTHRLFCPDSATVVAGNRGLCSFDSKTCFATRFFIQNILETMTNPFMTLKNRPKTKLNPKQKINSSSDLFFHELLRYKST